jgi:hypothetical protein
MKGGDKMTIQGTGMSDALRMYNNYASRSNNANQSEAAEFQVTQEEKQQVSVEGTEPPDGKGVPRGKPPAGGGPRGAGGPPPKARAEAVDDEDSSSDVLGFSTLEELLQLTSSSSEGTVNDDLQAIMLKRFEQAYQSFQQPEMNDQVGQPPELNIDADNDALWSEEEIGEFIEAGNLDVNASEIISHYDTDGDSKISSEEREAMRTDNAFNLPEGGPRRSGGPGGMPPPEMGVNSDEDEETTEEEITNIFMKNFETAYLSTSRNLTEVNSYFDAVI